MVLGHTNQIIYLQARGDPHEFHPSPRHMLRSFQKGRHLGDSDFNRTHWAHGKAFQRRFVFIPQLRRIIWVLCSRLISTEHGQSIMSGQINNAGNKATDPQPLTTKGNSVTTTQTVGAVR